MISKHQIRDGTITEFVMSGVADADQTIAVIESEYRAVARSVLWDLSTSDVSGLTRDDMRRIAKAAKVHSVHEKTAFVGSSDFVFGMLRMYESHSEMEGVPLQMRVFRDRDEAIEWLQAQ